MSPEQSQYIWRKTIPHIEVGMGSGVFTSVIALLSTAHHDKSSSAPSLVFSRVVDLQDVDTKVVPLYLYRKDPDQHFQFQFSRPSSYLTFTTSSQAEAGMESSTSQLTADRSSTELLRDGLQTDLAGLSADPFFKEGHISLTAAIECPLVEGGRWFHFRPKTAIPVGSTYLSLPEQALWISARVAFHKSSSFPSGVRNRRNTKTYRQGKSFCFDASISATTPRYCIWKCMAADSELVHRLLFLAAESPRHESKKESRMFSPVKGNEWGKRSCQPLDRSIGGKALNEKMRRLYPLGNHLTLFKMSSCATRSLKAESGTDPIERQDTNVGDWLGTVTVEVDPTLLMERLSISYLVKEADVAMAKLMAEIQELMDRVKELDKEIQSLETKSKLKKDVAGATLIYSLPTSPCAIVQIDRVRYYESRYYRIGIWRYTTSLPVGQAVVRFKGIGHSRNAYTTRVAREPNRGRGSPLPSLVAMFTTAAVAEHPPVIQKGGLVIYSYAPSFFEPFGMYCPLTIDQIHQTEKLQFRTAAESSDLSTKGFVEFLWIALGKSTKARQIDRLLSRC
ncbi:hypothetical protein BUALT_BualtMtG0005500 (mitochondrion) [Buddleja alternifolia]|uniref:Uncharacterized protein n=1 Tax=Buddleja alternifolia TaxID=168488 RepID=A0AAV6W6Y2_9LAMI|nr:hypothetical protein BUALT_BualtUnG0039700 [Buddleja alternifolia]KAG8363175.1 hypothetical protein BUALT_BualtMtG0005500 [Buddleja alternifolia]